MKINFRLPNTRLCVVVSYRDNQKAEHLIPTPRDNETLRNEMLKKRVGYGEIRAVKAVEADQLIPQMTR